MTPATQRARHATGYCSTAELSTKEYVKAYFDHYHGQIKTTSDVATDLNIAQRLAEEVIAELLAEGHLECEENT